MAAAVGSCGFTPLPERHGCVAVDEWPSGAGFRTTGSTLLEVLLAVAILSSAIVFIFRSFTSSLTSVRFSQNITHACLVAERILWETHNRYKGGGPVQLEQGRCTIEEKNFDWVSEVTLPTPENLQQLKLRIWWPEKAREKPYQVEFETWLWKEQP